MKKKIIFALLSALIMSTAVGCNSNDTKLDDSFDTFSPFVFKFENAYFDEENKVNIMESDSAIYQMDYRLFVDTNVSFFNVELAKLALLLSCNLYSWNTYMFSNYGDYQEDTFINKIKAKNITEYHIDANRFESDLNDLCGFELAHYEYDYKNEHQQIFFITYKGTDQEVEWMSNFDVGADIPEYYKNSSHEEWTYKLNHKGYEIAAKRSYDYIDRYINAYKLDNYNPILFISGHSRGAGIANLAGYHFSGNKSYKTFCYTFGTSGTTTTNNNLSNCIHNVINTEDMIANIIPESTGFTRYGYTHAFTGSDYIDIYENFANHRYYDFDISLAKEELTRFIPTRESVYKMPSQYLDPKAQSFGYKTEILANAARIAFLESIKLFYDEGLVEISDVYEDGNLGWGYKWKAVPSLLLEGLGKFMSDKNILNVAFLPLLFPSFANILFPKLGEIVFGIEPIAYPHMPEAYWVYLTQSQK